MSSRRDAAKLHALDYLSYLPHRSKPERVAAFEDWVLQEAAVLETAS
ncbi:MAG TPA: hypothetical protein VES91_04260 [Burkholderiaceae bacterium]|nr:hypothetical protein [Burkholderiaceae bacterium]